MPSQPVEVWREIPGFPNYYASTLGRISSQMKSCKPRLSGTGILKPAVHSKTGYMHVCVFRDRVSYCRMVHCLVALTFLGPRPPRMDINHKDGNKQNNRLCNLEYVTSTENQMHAYRIGLRRGQRKLAKEMAEQVRSLYEAGSWTQRQLAQRFDVGVKCIWNVLNGRTWPEERVASNEAA